MQKSHYCSDANIDVVKHLIECLKHTTGNSYSNQVDKFGENSLCEKYYLAWFGVEEEKIYKLPDKTYDATL